VHHGINYMIGDLGTLFIITRIPLIFYNLDIHIVSHDKNWSRDLAKRTSLSVWLYNNQKEYINVKNVYGFKIP